MAVAALIIGVLTMSIGLIMSLIALRRSGEAAAGTHGYSTALALIGAGCLLAMGSLLLVW